ncbi:hypothetical protein ABK040_009507 [Willaertia magna]
MYPPHAHSDNSHVNSNNPSNTFGNDGNHLNNVNRNNVQMIATNEGTTPIDYLIDDFDVLFERYFEMNQNTSLAQQQVNDNNVTPSNNNFNSNNNESLNFNLVDPLTPLQINPQQQFFNNFTTSDQTTNTSFANNQERVQQPLHVNQPIDPMLLPFYFPSSSFIEYQIPEQQAIFQRCYDSYANVVMNYNYYQQPSHSLNNLVESNTGRTNNNTVENTEVPRFVIPDGNIIPPPVNLSISQPIIPQIVGNPYYPFTNSQQSNTSDTNNFPFFNAPNNNIVNNSNVGSYVDLLMSEDLISSNSVTSKSDLKSTQSSSATVISGDNGSLPSSNNTSNSLVSGKGTSNKKTKEKKKKSDDSSKKKRKKKIEEDSQEEDDDEESSCSNEKKKIKRPSKKGANQTIENPNPREEPVRKEPTAIDIALNSIKNSNMFKTILLNDDPIIECVKFTPKKKMEFNLLCLFEVALPYQFLFGQTFDIHLDQSLLLRYGKRSALQKSNETSSEINRQTLGFNQLFFTAQIISDGVLVDDVEDYFRFKTDQKNQKTMPMSIIEIVKDKESLNRWNEHIVGTNINAKVNFNLEVKLVKPIKGFSIYLILDVQQKVPLADQDCLFESIIQWKVPILVQGSRRKKKSEKDSELKECFGEKMWPMVDLQLAMLNRKGAENEDEELEETDDCYGLFNSIFRTHIERPINENILNELIKEAENNMNRDSNNLQAIDFYHKYFERKFMIRTSEQIYKLVESIASKVKPLPVENTEDVITPNALFNQIGIENITDIDLNILLKLTYLYSRYETTFQSNGCLNCDKMIKYCCQIATADQFPIKTKIFSLYRNAEAEYLKLLVEKNRLSYHSLEKCNQCYFFIQKCLKEEPTMTRADVQHIKALEASILNVKSILLGNIHGLGSSNQFNNLNENEIEERLVALKDVINYKHAAFQIRGRFTPRNTAFAQACNNVASSLRVYFKLFKKTQKYTPQRAIVMLNAIKKIQSRAVTVHKQANPNTSHMAYALYKLNLKVTEVLLLEEKKASDPTDTSCDDKLEKAIAEKKKAQANYKTLYDQFIADSK